MKKLILFAAILFAGVSVVSAAEPITSDVQFQLRLHAFQSIEIGGGDPGEMDGTTGLVGGKVVLNYNTAEKYESGVSRTINDHIKIKAGGGFTVKVSSADASLNNDGNEAGEVPMNTIALTAVANGDVGATIHNDLKLSTEGQTFISSESGLGEEISFNVTYTGGKGYGQYVDKTGALRELETKIVYEIIAG